MDDSEFSKDLPAHVSDIGYMLKILNDTLEKKMNENLRSHGLTFAQFRTILHIYSNKDETITQKDLEDFFEVSHPTINGILKRLEEKKFITTEISVNRRLTKIVKITEEGINECEKAKDHRVTHEALLAKYLEPGEKETLISLLQKVYKAVNE
jgi:MarR family multiple gene transcriptional regulator MgrA